MEAFLNQIYTQITTEVCKILMAQQCIFLKTGILDFFKKYWFKTTQDTTQMIFRTFQAKLGPVKFFHFLLIKWRFFRRRQ